MSEQLHRPDKSARISRHTAHERGRDERGFITPRAAINLSKAALALVLLGTPIVAGASYGARSVAPPVMSGEIGVTDPAKVELLETKIERELCIANAIVKVSGAMGFEGHPLGNDVEGKLFGLVDYNLNLEREQSAEVYRKIRYCMKGMNVPYAYNPNVAFGDSTNPAITAELSLDKITVIVSALNDGRDKSHSVSDGVLGLFASDLNKSLEQKVVQDRIGKELAQNADVLATIDGVLTGTLNGYLDKEAAVRCLQAGEKYDWQNSPVGQLIMKAATEAIQEDFLNKDRNRPQPSASDISLKIVDDVAIDPAAQVMNQTKNDNNENALNLITKQTLENGAPRELDINGVKIPISYVINPATSTAGECIVSPESEASTLTAGDKGEE